MKSTRRTPHKCGDKEHQVAGGATFALYHGGKRTNPLKGVRFYTDPRSAAAILAQELARGSAADCQRAVLLTKLAKQPTGIWLGEWNGDVRRTCRDVIRGAAARNQVPVFVLYNFPNRDAGGYSRGGALKDAKYKAWIREFIQGIGHRRAIVVLEPDATGLFSDNRMPLVRHVARALKLLPAAITYIPAPGPRWLPPQVAARRLTLAGVAFADGFAVNVSGYETTEECIRFGIKVSRLLRGKHFVVDTSRNGRGPLGNEWCNPPGRALGHRPTAATHHPLVDAFLWIKKPGESDGECRGGPPAGQFWIDRAIELVKNAEPN